MACIIPAPPSKRQQVFARELGLGWSVALRAHLLALERKLYGLSSVTVHKNTLENKRKKLCNVACLVASALLVTEYNSLCSLAANGSQINF